MIWDILQLALLPTFLDLDSYFYMFMYIRFITQKENFTNENQHNLPRSPYRRYNTTTRSRVSSPQSLILRKKCN